MLTRYRKRLKLVFVTSAYQQGRWAAGGGSSIRSFIGSKFVTTVYHCVGRARIRCFGSTFRHGFVFKTCARHSLHMAVTCLCHRLQDSLFCAPQHFAPPRLRRVTSRHLSPAPTPQAHPDTTKTTLPRTPQANPSPLPSPWPCEHGPGRHLRFFF